MDHSHLNIAGVCSGVGMLETAVELGCEHLGYRTRLALCCEWEAYAAACLLARMEEQSLEPAPIFCGDLRDFDGRTFRGVVDILCAGLPCQPYSCAGKQRGLDDERSYGDGDGPIPHFLRIVAECRPAVVFVENVPPWVRGGFFRPVGEELSRLGYTVESPLFVTAESVGANHKRERVFVLAHAPWSQWSKRAGWQRVFDDGAELAKPAQQGFGIVRQPSGSDGQPDGGNPALAHAGGKRRSKDARSSLGHEETHGRTGRNWGEQDSDHEPERTHATLGQPPSSGGRQYKPGRGSNRRTALRRAGEAVGDTSGARPGADAAPGGPRDSTGEPDCSLAHPELPRPQGDGPGEPQRRGIVQPCGTDWRVFAPGPGADWSAIPETLWPAIEPGFRVLVDGMAVVLDQSRADALRCGGNGVVATAAAVAFVELMRRAKLG